ncbi:MAG TPA: hypothetical protein VNC50_10020 [Planctomycetia bacterium]|jgi:hypothetical protein|nr:hypothetical protein [Planctomycetia bacterium]
MPAPEALHDLYLNLARAAEETAKPQQRDRFLVLAASAACQAGDAEKAEACRTAVLQHDPAHLFGNYPTVEAALEAPDGADLANMLVRMYPFEKAEFLLDRHRAGEQRESVKASVSERARPARGERKGPAEAMQALSDLRKRLASAAELMRRQTDTRREIAAAVAPALEPKKRAMVPLSACIAYVTVAFAVGAGMVLMLSLQVR